MRCQHGFEENQCARCTALKAMTAAQNAAREAAAAKAKAKQDAANLLANEQFQKENDAALAAMDAACSLAA